MGWWWWCGEQQHQLEGAHKAHNKVATGKARDTQAGMCEFHTQQHQTEGHKAQNAEPVRGGSETNQNANGADQKATKNVKKSMCRKHVKERGRCVYRGREMRELAHTPVRDRHTHTHTHTIFCPDPTWERACAKRKKVGRMGRRHSLPMEWKRQRQK